MFYSKNESAYGCQLEEKGGFWEAIEYMVS